MHWRYDILCVPVATSTRQGPRGRVRRYLQHMASSAISHVIGFDDAPFPRNHRGNVRVLGAVFAGLRLEGVVSGVVRRDGLNSTRTLARLVADSKFGYSCSSSSYRESLSPGSTWSTYTASVS